MCKVVLPTCMYVNSMHTVPAEDRRAHQNPFEPELQTVVCGHVGAGSQT